MLNSEPIIERFADLMREMQEIESQRSVVPPVPASRVKDQLTDDAWALQYLEDGKSFNINVRTYKRFLFKILVFVLNISRKIATVKLFGQKSPPESKNKVTELWTQIGQMSFFKSLPQLTIYKTVQMN